MTSMISQAITRAEQARSEFQSQIEDLTSNMGLGDTDEDWDYMESLDDKLKRNEEQLQKVKQLDENHRDEVERLRNMGDLVILRKEVWHEEMRLTKETDKCCSERKCEVDGVAFMTYS